MNARAWLRHTEELGLLILEHDIHEIPACKPLRLHERGKPRARGLSLARDSPGLNLKTGDDRSRPREHGCQENNEKRNIYREHAPDQVAHCDGVERGESDLREAAQQVGDARREVLHRRHRREVLHRHHDAVQAAVGGRIVRGIRAQEPRKYAYILQRSVLKDCRARTGRSRSPMP